MRSLRNGANQSIEAGWHSFESRTLAGSSHQIVDALLLARVFVCAFFAACLIQSGLDKVTDRRGNLDWLTGHFSKSFLRSQVPMMLATVTLIELLGGFGCLGSVFVILFKGPAIVPTIALSLVCLNFVMLFTGQRIAKDYAGAASLASYFLVAVFGLTLMTAT